MPLPVGLLTEQAARDLLARRLGAGRVAREQQETAELVALCSRLPLALNNGWVEAFYTAPRARSPAPTCIGSIGYVRILPKRKGQ